MKIGRVVGIDDGFFERGKDRRAPLVLTVMKSSVIEGFRFGWVTVDGDDATDSILDILPDTSQISAVFLSGTIFGGTNVVDLEELYEAVKKPIVAVVEDPPEEGKILKSLSTHGTPSSVERYRRNPSMRPLETRRGILYVSFVGLTMGECKRLVEAYQFAGKLPEPLRISHLLGREVGRWI